MDYENMTAEERGIAQAEARFGYYRDYSLEELKEEKIKLEEDLDTWTKKYENPTRPEEKSDAWTDIKFTNDKLDFLNKVLKERTGKTM